jgi:sugar lactone lactonase YvrE
MGPVAWTTERAAFDAGGGGAFSHYDMLHESPYCMGIAWSGAHVWWAFNGQDSSIDRYDFHGWHPDTADGLGGNDHSDGEIFRYAQGQVRRVPDVPSHMVHDPADSFVYVNDTGNGRIVRISSAFEAGTPMAGRINEPGTRMYRCNAELQTVVAAGELTQPSGMALYNDLLYVSDFATGEIKAFTTAGELVNWLDTGKGQGVSGLAISRTGVVYFAQSIEDAVYRIDPIVPPQG